MNRNMNQCNWQGGNMNANASANPNCKKNGLDSCGAACRCSCPASGWQGGAQGNQGGGGGGSYWQGMGGGAPCQRPAGGITIGGTVPTVPSGAPCMPMGAGGFSSPGFGTAPMSRCVCGGQPAMHHPPQWET